MPPRESEAERLWKEWRGKLLESLESLSERVHRLELELAVIKVKFGIAMVCIGAASSLVTSLLVAYLLKVLNLK